MPGPGGVLPVVEYLALMTQENPALTIVSNGMNGRLIGLAVSSVNEPQAASLNIGRWLGVGASLALSWSGRPYLAAVTSVLSNVVMGHRGTPGNQHVAFRAAGISTFVTFMLSIMPVPNLSS